MSEAEMSALSHGSSDQCNFFYVTKHYATLLPLFMPCVSVLINGFLLLHLLLHFPARFAKTFHYLSYIC